MAVEQGADCAHAPSVGTTESRQQVTVVAATRLAQRTSGASAASKAPRTRMKLANWLLTLFEIAELHRAELAKEIRGESPGLDRKRPRWHGPEQFQL